MGISTKEELKDYIKYEHDLYIEKEVKKKIEQIVTSDYKLRLFSYIKTLRYQEYYHNQNNKVSKLLYLLCRRRTNKIGLKLGIETWDNVFGKGLTIFHPGYIVINGNCKIGCNLKLHGCNCIGNNGYNSAAPVIGNNVRLGVGASIIGNVFIADDVTIAAGAVVVTSCYKRGALLAGIPATEIVKVEKRKENP